MTTVAELQEKSAELRKFFDLDAMFDEGPHHPSVGHHLLAAFDNLLLGKTCRRHSSIQAVSLQRSAISPEEVRNECFLG